MASCVIGLRGQKTVSHVFNQARCEGQISSQNGIASDLSDVSGFTKLLELRSACADSSNVEDDITGLSNRSAWRPRFRMQSNLRRSPRAYVSEKAPTPGVTHNENDAKDERLEGPLVSSQKASVSPASSSARQVCWQYRDTGKCSRGAECRFLHVQSMDKTSQQARLHELQKMGARSGIGTSSSSSSSSNCHFPTPTALIEPRKEAWTSNTCVTLVEDNASSKQLSEQQVSSTWNPLREDPPTSGCYTSRGSEMLGTRENADRNNLVEVRREVLDEACEPTSGRTEEPSSSRRSKVASPKRQQCLEKLPEVNVEAAVVRERCRRKLLPKVPQPLSRRPMVVWKTNEASIATQAKMVARTRESLRLLCQEMVKLKEICQVDDEQFCADLTSLSRGIVQLRKRHGQRSRPNGISMSTMSTTAGTPMFPAIASSPVSFGASTVSSPTWGARAPAPEEICDAITAIVSR